MKALGTVLSGGRHAVAAAACALAVFAGGPAGAAGVFRLLPGSTYQEGCVGPCDCPVLVVGDLTGTFRLSPAARIPSFMVFTVEEIDWSVENEAGEVIDKITGRGVYELDLFAKTQRLVLDVTLEGAATHLDSGIVPEERVLPLIEIRAAQGLTCFDHWVVLRAAPAGVP